MDIKNIKARLLLMIVCTIFAAFGLLFNSALAQQIGSTPTPTVDTYNSSVTAKNEGANVRTGPGSFDYPIIGSLQPGETAPAIGRSPAGEWIQIIFEAAPLGNGWVYAANVTLSPEALLPVVEPPPTKMPDVMLTPNATFEAELKTEAPPTRMPTFTDPAPISIPTFQNPSGSIQTQGISSWLILVLGVVGIGIYIISKIGKR
jgi:hypothetical protein